MEVNQELPVAVVQVLCVAVKPVKVLSGAVEIVPELDVTVMPASALAVCWQLSL